MAINGIILVDKPKGPTTSQVTAWVGDIIKQKTAHCGTLDPFATGVVPILTGKAIKLQEYLQEHDKDYICLFELEKKIDVEQLKMLLAQLTGKIYQRPPEMSAVAKNIRIRNVYFIDVIELKNKDLLLKIRCQHGTYIRKLAEDLGILTGQKIKLTELRRIKVNGFDEKQANPLTKIKDLFEAGKIDEIVISLESAVSSFPKVIIHENAAEKVMQGSPLMRPGIIEIKGDIAKGRPVAMLTVNNKLIGIGIALKDGKQIKESKTGKMIQPRKIVV